MNFSSFHLNKIINWLSKLGLFLFIIFITYLTVKVFKKIINNYLKGRHFDKTQLTFLKHFISGSTYVLGVGIALSTIPSFKSISTSLFAGSGIIAIIIGFASQQAFSNIVSGIFISIFQPFRIGDKIRFIGRETVGTVEDITLRHTIINTYENKRVIVPNSVISTEIIENSSIVEEKICKFFEIGISYDSDVDKAMSIIESSIKNHKDFYDNRSPEEKKDEIPEVSVKLIGFGESSLNLKSWVWAPDNLTGVKMIWDLNYTIKKKFDEAGIEIPFPYRTIVFKNNNKEIADEIK